MFTPSNTDFVLNHSRFAAVNLSKSSGGPEYSEIVDALAADDEARINFLKACLSKLGLVVSQEQTAVPSLTKIHLSAMEHHEVPEILESWKEIIDIEDGEEYIRGENDTFRIEKQQSRWSFNSIVKSLPLPGVTGDIGTTTEAKDDTGIVDYNKIMKTIIPHEAEWPGSKETPYFNHNAYYTSLRRYQEEGKGEADDIGKVLLHGEVVTSTNTLLEK